MLERSSHCPHVAGPAQDLGSCARLRPLWPLPPPTDQPAFPSSCVCLYLAWVLWLENSSIGHWASVHPPYVVIMGNSREQTHTGQWGTSTHQTHSCASTRPVFVAPGLQLVFGQPHSPAFLGVCVLRVKILALKSSLKQLLLYYLNVT